MVLKWNPVSKRYENQPANRQVASSDYLGNNAFTPKGTGVTNTTASGTAAPTASTRAKGRVGGTTTPKPVAKPAQKPQGPALFGTADQPYNPTVMSRILGEEPEFANDNQTADDLISSILGTIGGGKANTDRQDYARAIQAAKMLESAGQRAQQQYGTQADAASQALLARLSPLYQQAEAQVGTEFDARQKALEDLYAGQLTQGQQFITGQQTAGQQAISKAQADLLAQLTAPTAYQNVPLAMTTPEMQALGQQLSAYGASGQPAEAARTESADFARQLAEIERRQAGQLNTAETNYINALRNAGVGAGAAAQQNLATTAAGLLGSLGASVAGQRAQGLGDLASERARAMRTISEGRLTGEQQAEDLRQKLLTAGIEAGMAGTQARAEAESAAVKQYGAPKPKKKTRPTNPKRGK